MLTAQHHVMVTVQHQVMLTAQQDSDTDLRGAAEYIPVRNYLEFKNNLLEASHSIFTKAITLYIEGEEFMVR